MSSQSVATPLIRRRRKGRKTNWAALLVFLAPAVIAFLVFNYYPLFKTIYMSLFNWGLVLGAFTRYGDFAVLPRPLQGSIVFFATVDLLAAVCLWLAAPWGGVLWLLCASIETVSPALGVRGATTGMLGVGLNVALVALYFFLTWRAGQELA